MTQAELFACIEETNLFLEHEELRDAVLVANWYVVTPYQNRLVFSVNRVIGNRPLRSKKHISR